MARTAGRPKRPTEVMPLEAATLTHPEPHEQNHKMTPEEARAELADILRDVSPQRAIPLPVFNRICYLYNRRQPTPDLALAGVSSYAWRLFPMIDGRLNGRKNTNIQTIKHVEADGSVTPLPENWENHLTGYHGGGKYRISLNDASLERDGPHSQVAQTMVTISDIEHEPILDPNELVLHDPPTMQWIQRQVSLNRLVKHGDRYKLAGTMSSSSGAGTDFAMETLAKLAERGATPQADANTAGMWGLVNTLMQKAMDGKPADNSIALIIPAMVQMQEKNNALQMELMQKLFADLRQAQAPAPSHSIEDELARLEKYRELFKGMGRTAGPPAGFDWEGFLKGLAPFAMPLLAAAVNKFAGGNGATAPAPLHPPPAIAPAATNDPRAIGLNAFTQLAGNVLMRGQDGSDLANAIEVLAGPEAYDAVAAMGREALLAAVTPAPQLAGIPADQLAGLVDVFIAYSTSGTSAPPEAAPAANPMQPAAAGAGAAA